MYHHIENISTYSLKWKHAGCKKTKQQQITFLYITEHAVRENKLYVRKPEVTVNKILFWQASVSFYDTCDLCKALLILPDFLLHLHSTSTCVHHSDITMSTPSSILSFHHCPTPRPHTVLHCPSTTVLDICSTAQWMVSVGSIWTHVFNRTKRAYAVVS